MNDTPAENIVFDKVEVGWSLTINAPAAFKDPAFVAWLNNKSPKLTLHQVGQAPSEWSDVVVLVDPSFSGDGSDSDMPGHIWSAIVAVCKSALLPSRGSHITVRLIND